MNKSQELAEKLRSASIDQQFLLEAEAALRQKGDLAAARHLGKHAMLALEEKFQVLREMSVVVPLEYPDRCTEPGFPVPGDIIRGASFPDTD